MLKITGIKKSFGRKSVLKNVSMIAKPGQLIHISGINGSGKSTIFKIVTGLLEADSGKVELDHGDVIGALIENPSFLEYESAMTNLHFLANLNHRFNEKRVRSLLQQFELDPDDSQAIAKYSVGMRQKVGIIQAVMEEQNIILLDEPTRGIDQESIGQFLTLLNRLKQENKTVIIASHDQIDEINYDQDLTLQNGILLNE
ncbi:MULTISPECIES: ATP-binding cassette domain-containing protein [unclassified Lactobacillus]|uniref:ATP-binding cassette domain-containing protein n=1 Tax=unclassified Lactobacillus TaxID=2620435 RepID=UPI00226A903D|nr:MULTISPECIES: ABC transporter ATP-binding protein [unclassified Lactobacillus]MCX8722089.1 ABC transporter ATP-binding protein [Lactobacillus sp. B4010]MCX8732727.1 ABC transporter ATP-binding protein [Lactobacillus sp. B4015]MCX8734947.1 ABC transporter ATP-binding protein [Lactobacillus sp. B4012]